MRRFAFALLATAAAAPALAQSTPEERRAAREQAREQARSERAEARAEQRERSAEPVVQAPQRSLVPHQPGQRRPSAIDRAVERGRPSLVVDRQRPTLEQRRENRDGAATRRQQRLDNRDSVTNWRQEQREQLRQSRGERRADRIAERGPRQRVTPPANARPDVPAPPPKATARHVAAPRWQSSWHNDSRYNWRDHRRRFGSLFRLGFYFDPFGWGYHRYGRGWRLWPSYYDSYYWLSDPFMYRLPYAPYPYKWIRYWDDALLVDTYTGQVVDVAHDFFW